MDRHRHSAGSASPALHYWYFIYFYWQTHGPKGNMPLHRRQIDATKRTHTHAHTVTTVCVLGQIKFDVWFKNFARVQWENYIRRVFFSLFLCIRRRCQTLPAIIQRTVSIFIVEILSSTHNQSVNTSNGKHRKRSHPNEWISVRSRCCDGRRHRRIAMASAKWFWSVSKNTRRWGVPHLIIVSVVFHWIKKWMREERKQKRNLSISFE